MTSGGALVLVLCLLNTLGEQHPSCNQRQLGCGSQWGRTSGFAPQLGTMRRTGWAQELQRGAGLDAARRCPSGPGASWREKLHLCQVRTQCRSPKRPCSDGVSLLTPMVTGLFPSSVMRCSELRIR